MEYDNLLEMLTHDYTNLHAFGTYLLLLLESWICSAIRENLSIGQGAISSDIYLALTI